MQYYHFHSRQVRQFLYNKPWKKLCHRLNLYTGLSAKDSKHYRNVLLFCCCLYCYIYILRSSSEDLIFLNDICSKNIYIFSLFVSRVSFNETKFLRKSVSNICVNLIISWPRSTTAHIFESFIIRMLLCIICTATRSEKTNFN